jgi:excisionase family DNA binding protein
MTPALDITERQVRASEPRVMTPAMLAERWNVRPRFVVKLIEDGELAAFRIGTLWRVTAEALEEYEARQSAPLSKMGACYVYFIRRGDFVKIGKAGNVEKRLRALQAANPEPLELLATVYDDNGHALERELHRKFAALRTTGEWFRLESELAEFIRELP